MIAGSGNENVLLANRACWKFSGSDVTGQHYRLVLSDAYLPRLVRGGQVAEIQAMEKLNNKNYEKSALNEAIPVYEWQQIAKHVRQN